VITTFCDFRQFSAEKCSFSTKKQCNDQIFAKNGSALNKKRHFLGASI
jgi:hypothetical protein